MINDVSAVKQQGSSLTKVSVHELINRSNANQSTFQKVEQSICKGHIYNICSAFYLEHISSNSHTHSHYTMSNTANAFLLKCNLKKFQKKKSSAGHTFTY